MKIRMMMALGMMVLTAGFAAAAEEQKQAGQPQPTPPQERREVGRRALPDREAMFKEMQASRANSHQQAVNELLELKKLAEEENAPKTAAAIQAMIDKKNEDYKKSIEQMERQRRERAEQLQQRMSERQSERPQRPQGTTPDAPQQ